MDETLIGIWTSISPHITPFAFQLNRTKSGFYDFRLLLFTSTTDLRKSSKSDEV
jgi:hypothetical protein